MSVLDGKKLFAFDWDGTLLDSMPVKYRTFSTLLAAELHAPLAKPKVPLSQEIENHYRALSGLPRRQIVAAILEHFDLPPSTLDFGVFSHALGRLNREELARAQLFPDAVAFLRRLTRFEVSLYISSSVPSEELHDLVDRLLPDDLRSQFRAVLGSDGHSEKGVGHVEHMLRETGSRPSELIFFGDDLKDVELCQRAGISCVLIDRGGRCPGTEFAHHVASFSPLIGELDHFTL